MSFFKDKDEVTTTYESIQLSLEQAHAAGVKTEQERIIKLLQEQTDGYWIDTHYIEPIIALIKGKTND